MEGDPSQEYFISSDPISLGVSPSAVAPNLRSRSTARRASDNADVQQTIYGPRLLVNQIVPRTSAALASDHENPNPIGVRRI